MRLIEQGLLDERTVAELADRLGIGPRHLLRLFLRHTGATPSQIAATRRIQIDVGGRVKPGRGGEFRLKTILP